jgi:glycosyltransferase involved in cell wall biosynthesis
MNIVILNTNSFGGNYEYSRCLAEAYSASEFVLDCKVLIPANALQTENECFKKVLISDDSGYSNKILRKFYFLFRSIVNPFKTYQFLKRAPASVVVVNDFEQISSILWVPFFRLLKYKHTFIVILHDPNRDAYLPIKLFSEMSMNRVMSIMDLALYHEILPDKIYYKNDIPKMSVPHGLYTFEAFDQELFDRLIHQKGNYKMMGAIGNIRDEKNYSLLIDSLPYLPNVVLLIAGSTSSSAVSIASYKKQIEELNVRDQVIWVEKRLTDAEIQAAIRACDLMLLYYKYSFTSQSGLLNLIAPHKKKLIVSDGVSGLTKIVNRFNLGEVVSIEKNAFVDAVNKTILAEDSMQQQSSWDRYLDYASWNNHVRVVIEHIHALEHKKKKHI